MRASARVQKANCGETAALLGSEAAKRAWVCGALLFGLALAFPSIAFTGNHTVRTEGEVHLNLPPALASLKPVAFSVEGSIRYEILSARGQIVVEQEGDFMVSVQDCNWFIKKVPTRFRKAGRQQPLKDYSIASSDSINFYQIISFASIVEAAGRGTNTMTGRIGPGALPFLLSDPKKIALWYAFASHCYLQTVDDGYLYPATNLPKQELYARDFRIAAAWQLHDQLPFLPEIIAFAPPGGLLQIDGKRVPRLVPRAHDSDMQFTNRLLTVREFADTGALSLPKDIVIQSFRMDPSENSGVRLASNIEIRGTNFYSRSQVDVFRPAIPTSARISDLRTISTDTPFGVVEYSRDWPEAGVSRERASAIAFARSQHAGTRPRSGAAVRALMILLLVVPALWIWARRTRLGNKRS